MNTPETEERPHAERSSSQLKYLALCPGYRPRKGAVVHWVTKQGLRGHDALEKDDKGGLHTDFERRMVEDVERYLATLEQDVDVLKEVRIETIEGRWGYVDQVRVHRVHGVDTQYTGVADMVDFKFVKVKEVEDAEMNLQGKDYVCGLFDEHSFLHTIQVHFPMPRFGTVTTATFTRDMVPEMKLEILAILTRAKSTDRKQYKGRTLKPYFDACRFCGALARCGAVRRIADRIARLYDPDKYGLLPPIPEQTHASMTDDPEVLGRLKLLAGVMEPWADAVNHHCVEKALEAGVVANGYTLDYRKGLRYVTKPAELLLVAAEFGITVQDVVDNAKISITGLEELIKERAPRGQKTFEANRFLDRLRDLDAIGRGIETPTLVRQ